MKLYNTLKHQVEDFAPLQTKAAGIYSCGPTVYDHVHIGNLRAFVTADLLRRVLSLSGLNVHHVMNITDVDDKTIKKSAEEHGQENPKQALSKTTQKYKDIFLGDMKQIGNDTQALDFISATDSIEQMKTMITNLFNGGFAYVSGDGVYFSIEKYRNSGKKYGQLLEISAHSTSEQRIDNDEYDKDSPHDFALWKKAKSGEPSWPFDLGGHKLEGRPGWHIECSVMSRMKLGQPFDIHTGGVDLIFPHHENEIAQSTAGEKNPVFANFFLHNEHLLVEGKKMSKSLNNFFTLEDIIKKGFEPLAFRMLVLQSHYRSQMNFSWELLEAAQNRLQALENIAALRFQPIKNNKITGKELEQAKKIILSKLQDDLNTPEALAALSEIESRLETGISKQDQTEFNDFIEWLDNVFGLDLSKSKDINSEQKELLKDRQTAREKSDFNESDRIRTQLEEQGIAINDTPNGQIWQWIN